MPPRTAIITCAVLEEEVMHFINGMSHIVHVEVMMQGLHNDPSRLREQLQLSIDRIERMKEVDAIVLVYGLCSRGTEGIHARHCQLVIARAHDCITHLLGSRHRYASYMEKYPGTYWYSPGWNRHHTPPGPERYSNLYREYCQKFGEDNAVFLMATEQNWFKTYSRAAYVDLTIGATNADVQYTQRCAQWLTWSFDHQHGDPRLLRDLLAGNWDDERFLIIRPGQTLRITNDDRVMQAVSCVTSPGTDDAVK